MYFVYNLFTKLIILISPIVFIFRILYKKEDPIRFLEKYCIYGDDKEKSTSLWIHAASVGELMSIIPVLRKLEQQKKIKKILLTTSTISSADIFQKLKFKKTIHRYFPLDENFLTKKFIKYWSPKAAIFVDSEIWPNMFNNLNIKKIPIIIINARITKKSFERWKILKIFATEVFSKISLALPANLETSNYLKKFGVNNVQVAGNLKFYGKQNIENKISISIKKKFLEKMGMEEELRDHVFTSGEAALNYLKKSYSSKKFFHIGPPRDFDLFNPFKKNKSSDLVDSEYLLCTGLFDDHDKDLNYYKNLFEAHINKKMICTNPDLIVDRGNTRELCAGSVAMVFEKMGGEVVYFGKPHAEVYNLSIDNLNKRTLAIGDNLNTDIKGANLLNYDSLLISNGIHKLEILNKGISEVSKEYETVVNYTQSDLRW